MKKSIQYFYIFSKLTTSLFLLLIVLILGFALVKSYKKIDNEVVDLETTFNSFSNEILNNNNNKYIILNEKINEINNNLKNNQSLISREKYEKDIQNLINLNNELNKKIDNLINKRSLSLNNNKNKKITDFEEQVSSLINLIIIKYKDGKDTNQEFTQLEKILHPNKYEILYKINIIKLNKFYGLNNLKKEFDIATKELVNAEFTPSNKNLVLNFIFKFIDVRPNDLNIYQKKELNLIMEAKKNLEKEDLGISLEVILKLDKNQKYFNKWIKQVNIYLSFINEIHKVI